VDLICHGRRVLVLALMLLALDFGVASAGGFFLYEIGTQDVGLASAGYGAGTLDPSTLFTNPAGMTHLEGDQLMAGVQGLLPKLQFSPNTASTKAGTDGGQAIVPLPGGGFFYEHSLTKDLKIGIGTFAYFGGALEYNLNWVGRYFLQGATIIGQSIQPTIAYRVNNWLSVGAGPIFMIGYLREKVAINNLLPSLGDGKLKLQDWTLGYGGNIGVMLEPRADTRIGVTYLTPVSLNFNPAANFTGLGPGLTALLLKRGLLTGSIDLGITVPQAVTLGIFHQFNDRFAIMGNINWQNWSQFGLVDVTVDSANPKSLTTNLNYKDTGHVAVGGQYRPQDRWLLMAGFAFDSSMVNESDRTVSAPIGAQYRYGLGAQYEYSKSVKLGFDYELQWWGNLSLTQGDGGRARGTVSGTFADTFVNVFCANVTYRFGVSSQTSK
jgi:long-chain fatty acid transport protein